MTDIQKLDSAYCVQLAVLDQQLMADEGNPTDKSLVMLEIRMRSWLGNGCEAIGVLDQGLVVAFCLYRILDERILVKKLFVSEDFRRQGIATELIATVRSLSEYLPIELHVTPENDGALSFYHTLGFHERYRTLSDG